MDPSICPTFWNDSTHEDFNLPMERPLRVPAVDEKVHISIRIRSFQFMRNLFSYFRHGKFQKPPNNLEKIHLSAGQEHWMELNLEKGDALSFVIECACFQYLMMSILS